MAKGKKPRKRKKRLRECVLCGKRAELTHDHVPAKSMFPAGTRLITIPSCLACNRTASRDNEYFRAVVALRREVEHNPVVNQILPEVMRGLFRASRGNMASIVESARAVDVVTPAGIYLGEGGTYVPDDARMCREAGRIVRGLYYHERRTRLPDTHGVAVYVVANFDLGLVERVREWCAFAFRGKVTTVHRSVFTYGLNSIAEREDVTVWVLTFYGHTPILCFTLPRADSRDPRPLQ